MKCVVLQPCYIPWRGYFDQIHRADTFVFYDDVQYDKHGWRNRNRIKTPQGTKWLTIPVHTKGVVGQGIPINEVRINWNTRWAEKHWRSIEQNYGKAPFFERYAPGLQPFFARRDEFLSDFIIDLTEHLARELGIENTRFLRSSALSAKGTKTARVLSVLRQLGATSYLSGPSAADYLETEQFEAAGIALEYIAYDYPEYAQLYPPYDPHVTILDLLFMKGPDAGALIWG